MKKAIIIGAGPAGLTAAYELLENTDIIPVIFEAGNSIGGISKTVVYKGNRIDIGGHRFFSKSKRVMDWWIKILPVENDGNDVVLSYQNKQTILSPEVTADKTTDDRMLIRNRLSRILFLGKLFDYPLKINFETARKLGFLRIVKIGCSYIYAHIFPVKNEKSLEDFFINRFGRELYHTFFKDYTEKVWGLPCTSISSDWGRQRIKELSLASALWNALKIKGKDKPGIEQKKVNSSLIEKFLYPKYGPGQLWEKVAGIIQSRGGSIHFESKVEKITVDNNKVVAITAINKQGEAVEHAGDYFFSTMPVVDLVNGMGAIVPATVKDVANKLVYRDFIMVGILVKDLKLKNPDHSAVKDNWIYIQEKNVKLGRLQIYNNWSPYMVKDENTTWLGLEYFCNEGDELWNSDDEALKTLAVNEIVKINIIHKKDFLDATIIRMPKTYPSYVGAYNEFDNIITFTDSIENLFLIGRNGMHKYNNQDHSMLTAMQAVENIQNNITAKKNIWEINTDDTYQEN